MSTSNHYCSKCDVELEEGEEHYCRLTKEEIYLLKCDEKYDEGR